MGDHNSLDNPGYTECHSLGIDVHLPTEEAQSDSQGKARK